MAFNKKCESAEKFLREIGDSKSKSDVSLQFGDLSIADAPLICFKGNQLT